MEERTLKKLIVMEPDIDLAQCVSEFFGDQYEVTRVQTMEQLKQEFEGGDPALLIIDFETCSEDRVSTFEQLHRDFPRTRIVATYFSPPAKETWERRIRDNADVFIRKPYGVVDVDRAIRALGTNRGNS